MEGVAEATALLNDGVSTLSQLLPLFDSGFGSFYDLRHLSLEHAYRGSPEIVRLISRGDDATLRLLSLSGPNRARWSYHRIHLLQLYQLAHSIAPKHARLWNLFFDRWLAYSWGYRSRHN